MNASVVSVVGSAVCTPAQAETAEEVGRLLADHAAILVCSGRGGVMEAACRGAQKAGGLTPDMVRLSIGLEHIDDIKNDLEQAFGQL